MAARHGERSAGGVTSHMLRRDFLPALGLGLLTPAALAALSAGRLERIGLELYAVRKAMRANPEQTLAAIRAIGYTDVELLWSFKNFDRSIKQVKEALKNTGLKAPSAHMAPETILTDWETRVGEAKELGQQYIIAPGLPSEANKSIDVWKLWANRFNAAGEVARRAGIWLALHNEPNHETPIMGEKPIEVFLRETDPKLVRFQLDVGNMLMGGGDPMAFLAKYRDRCWSFHVKNVTPDRKKDTELPKGTFDIKAFLAAVPDINKKPCFVEQEGTADELASAKENWGYLKSLTW
jgi:sugar phosphate isomerase/epimerase